MKRVNVAWVVLLVSALNAQAAFGEVNNDCGKFAGIGAGVKANKANILNNLGFELLKKNELELAAEHFYCAFKENDSHVNAHYNYACTLSLLYGIHPERISLKEIMMHLEKTAQLRPKKIEKIIADGDLLPISCTEEFSRFVDSNMKPQKFSVIATPQRVVKIHNDIYVQFLDIDNRYWHVSPDFAQEFYVQKPVLDSEHPVVTSMKYILHITSRVEPADLLGGCKYMKVVERTELISH